MAASTSKSRTPAETAVEFNESMSDSILPDRGTSTLDKTDSPPDGGRTAWLQVLGLWAIFAVTWGLANTFGVFQTYYENHLLSRTPPSAVSWIGSLQGALLLMMGPVSGTLYDAGYFRQLLLGGLFLIVLGQFMTSLARDYWQFILGQGVCIGIGCGFAYVPSAALLSQYFRQRQALALGIASTGSPIVGIIFPILFSRLQPTLGFPWACRIVAFVVLLLCLIPAFLLQVRTPPSGPVRSIVDRSALHDRRFMLFICGSFIAFLSLYIGYFYIQLFAVKSQIGPSDFSAYYVTLLNAGSIPGRLIPNYLADHWGHLNTQIVLSALTAVVMFAWMGIQNMGGLMAFALFYGAFTGGVMSILPPVTVALSPDPSRIGTRMGMVTFAAGVAVLVGPPIAGVIINDYSRTRWLSMTGYAGATTSVATILLIFARIAPGRRKSSSKETA